MSTRPHASASTRRPSETEPFALVRDTHAEWYQSPPRSSELSNPWSFLPDELVLVRGRGELSPAVAGALAGALAGPLMLLVAEGTSPRSLLLPARIAAWAGATAGSVGWIASVVFGVTVGVGFGTLTRRLRRIVPAVVFGATLSAATWTVIHVLYLRSALPWAPMVLGASAFGGALGLEVPLRLLSSARDRDPPRRGSDGGARAPAPDRSR